MNLNRTTSSAESNYTNNCPYIDIQWQKGQVFVSNSVFRLIGKPNAIILLWNADKSTLVIKPTEIDDPNGFPIIGKTYAKNGSLFIGSATLIYEIWETTNWDKALRFRIVARYNEVENIAIFEMKTAESFEIPRNIHGGRPKKNTDEQS